MDSDDDEESNSDVDEDEDEETNSETGSDDARQTLDQKDQPPIDEASNLSKCVELLQSFSTPELLWLDQLLTQFLIKDVESSLGPGLDQFLEEAQSQFSRQPGGYRLDDGKIFKF